MLYSLLVAHALAGFPAAPKAEHRISEWSVEAADLCFASGIRVVAVRRPGSGLVSMTAVVEGGLSAEGEAAQGASYAVAGLRPWARPLGSETPLAVAGIGTRSETRALHDALVLHSVAPADELEALIVRESAWLADPLGGIDAEAFNQARAHIEAKAWASADEGQLAGSHQLRKQLYPPAHAGRSMALPGSVHTLELDALRSHVAATHLPSRMTIRLEGDVPTDSNQLGNLLGGAFPDDLFRGRASCEAESRTGEVVEVSSTEPVAVRAPVARPEVHLGWHVPSTFAPDEIWLSRFADVLGFSMQRRVGFLLSSRHRARWLQGGCRVEQGARAALLHCVYDMPTEEYGERAAKAMLRSIPGPVESDDLARELADYGIHGTGALPQALSAWDSAEPGAAMWRGRYTHFTGEWQAAPSLSAAVAVDERAMTKKALEVIGRKNVAVALLLPAEPDVGEAATDPAPPLTLGELSAGSPPAPDLSGITELSVGRGLNVWIDTRGPQHLTVAEARLAVPGGAYTEHEPGVSEAWQTVMGWRNGAQANLLESRSGVTSSRWDKGYAWQVTGRAASANLAPLLWSMRHEIDVPFSSYFEEIQREGIEQRVEALLGSRTRDLVPPYPSLLAEDARRTVLLADHPAGLPWWERYKAGRTVPIGSLRVHARQTVRPERGVLVLTSSASADEATPVVRKFIAKWKGAPEPTEPPPPVELGEVGPRQLRAYQVTEPAVHVTVTCRLPGRTPATRPTLEVAAGALRSQLALRPELWVGEVSVLPIDARVALLEASVAVHPSHANHAVAGVLQALGTAREGLDDASLTAARREAALAHALGFSDASHRADSLTGFALDGYGLDAVEAHADALGAVSAEQVREVLSDCAGHESITVTGPVTADLFHGQVDKLELVDWRAELESVSRSFD